MTASSGTRLGPRFTLMWTASAISGLGDGVTLVAAPLLVASMTSSPLVVSGVFFAATLPWLPGCGPVLRLSGRG